jgi:dTDP-4-dehydrorhamnose 3,5-epimerase
MDIGQRDQATVRKDGQRLMKLIDGVKIRPAITHPDERGELCEIYDPAWGIHPEPLRYIYMATVRPGWVKGWVYHEKQDDRLFVISGHLKIVLYDTRKSGPTEGMINEIHVSERNRSLVTIPSFVAHAVQNVGTDDAIFVNAPTQPYNHDAPDKVRISLDSPAIPYSFDRRLGW